ncbi:MAG: hypothetical protein FWH29_06685 [Methanobrevibacter sp.]|nr:hypothetical protein [Methanobrevibacter sp.]
MRILNKKSKKIAINDITSYLKKTFKFTSEIAITYNAKVAKTASTSALKKTKSM